MEIKFCDVNFSYNTSTSICNNILDNISFVFESGNIYGIVGKSGSGKTTLLQMINGLLLPTSGKIMVGKYKLQNNSKQKSIAQLRSNIGFVFQFPEEQFFCSTVREEIQYAMKNFNIKVNVLDKQTSDALKMVGLNDDYLDCDPFSLSHGEMRKVALASALAYNPKVLILDEPTIGLDDNGKKNLIKIIRNLKLRYKKTVIIVSHDTDFLLKITDQVILLDNGKITLSGDKYTVLSNEKMMKNCNVKVPDILAFSNLVKRKRNIKIGYRDDINDLIKDIYRYVK